LKRAHYIALGSAFLLALVAFNLPGQAVARLKLALGSVFLPLFGLTSLAHQALPKAVDRLTPRGELIRQNDALRRENAELRAQLSQGQEALRENRRLRAIVGWKPQPAWTLKPARVVSRDPANWWRTAQIDLGTRDGLRAHLPVLTPEGLVGRVEAVGLTRSQIVLLGDPQCRVPALVENDRRDTGILGGASPLDGALVELTYLARAADLKPGQTVVTSGLGEIFPKGILIGKIVDAQPVEFGLYTQARVKLAANLNGLEEVWVLFP
jgi:rod shape-determining protein MreC